MRGLAVVILATSCYLACGGGGSKGGADGGAGTTGSAGTGGGPFAIDTSDGGFSDTVACTITEGTMKSCIETSGITKQAEVDYLRHGCTTPVSDASTNVHQRFDLGPCSHDHALGGCSVMSSGATVTTNWFYSGGIFTVNDVHSLCESAKATFVAP
jgi:hypothetical protein